MSPANHPGEFFIAVYQQNTAIWSRDCTIFFRTLGEIYLKRKSMRLFNLRQFWAVFYKRLIIWTKIHIADYLSTRNTLVTGRGIGADTTITSVI